MGDDQHEHDSVESGQASDRAYDAPLRPSTASPANHTTAREKLLAYLTEHPAGASGSELADLLFQGLGSGPAMGARLIRSLLGPHPQFCFDEATGLWSLRAAAALRVPLDEAEFVVVDLETTGGRVAPNSIIEIGAYRMRGRRLLDSFQSFVRPRIAIPRFITRLTTITDEMVAAAPPIEQVLPAFRDFLGTAVMVAHNAQFDHSHLDFEFRRIFGLGLLNPVLCTVRMARRLLPSVKRRRLDLLAEHFGLSTVGRHRALGDARMAAELLAIMLEIVASMGVDRLDRLIDLHGRGATGQRLERHVPPEALAALPRLPGVYFMRNERRDLLYIGKATRLKDRVSSYFNGGVNINRKTADLISHVWSVETIVTRSALEAGLMEARLIREHKPPYNRTLKAASPAYMIRLDLDDPFPRLRVAGKLTAKAGVLQLGPFIGRGNLDHSVRALSRLLGLRVCTGRLDPDEDMSPCVYGQMGHCTAPCNLTVDSAMYAVQVNRAISFLRGRSSPLLGDVARARDQAKAALRFEEARRLHRDLEALAALSERAGRRSRVVTENNLVIVIGSGDAPAASAAGASPEPPESTAQDLAMGAAGGIAPPAAPVAYVVLSGRLALTRDLDSPQAAREVATFIASNYDRYKLRAVTREELEPMAIVARWLKERTPTDGRLIYFDGPHLDTNLCQQYGCLGLATR